MSDTQATLLPAPYPLGSLPLRNPRHETYARCRALNLPPRASAVEAGLKRENGAVTKLERNANVQARIGWFAQQDAELLKAKRARLESFLWSVHESDYSEYFATVERVERDEDGAPILDKDGAPMTYPQEVIRSFDELSPEQRRLIESLKYTEKGRPILSVYSKMQANIELRKMNAIGASARDDGDDQYGRLSEADLITELTRQARELGIDVDLTYRFRGEQA